MQKLLPEIIERFYDAALRPEAWQEAVDLLNKAMPSVAFALYGHDYQTNSSTGQIHAGFDPRAIDDFNRHYSTVNVWARGFSEAPVGALVTSDSFVTRDELKRSEYYNDWLRPQENQVAGWGSVLSNDRRRFLAISSTMRERDTDALDDQLRLLIAQVHPHVLRAFRLAGEVAKQSQAEVKSWIDLLDGPAFALDSTGLVVAANARAAEASDVIDPVAARLTIRDAKAQRAVESIVADIAVHGSSPLGDISILSPSGRRWSAFVTPAPGASGRAPIPLADHLSRRAVALLMLRRIGDDRATRLRNRFGLSSAETDIAIMLGEGLTLADIAERRLSSIHTVRNQLRQIFGKTSVTRQSALLKVILGV